MCAAVELLLQIHYGERYTEKVDRVAGPSQPASEVKVKAQ